MKRLIFENFFWKLLALVVAVLFWFIVVGSPEFFHTTLPGAVRRFLHG
ncbi:MAG: hypothetical protein IT159_00335 [Bryobacterales bacterium]|nr:hypothetical protein [Bryobacterales bacterium]